MARERHTRRYAGSFVKQTPKRRSRLVIPILILFSMAVLYPAVMRGATPATVQINPSPMVNNPTTVFVVPGNVPVTQIGSTFTVQVKISTTAQFNGWDVELASNPGIVSAISISISGNDFAVNDSAGTPFELTHCVNNSGSGCTSTDGPGIAHSAYTNSGILTGSGLLFTVTYQVVGPGSYTQISLQNVTISSPTGAQDPSTNLNAGYGAQGGTGRALRT